MSASAQAAPLQCGGTFYLNPSNPTPVTGITWSIVPATVPPDDAAGYYCGNPNPQDAGSIADYIKDWFGLSATPTLVSQNDSLSGGVLNYTDTDGFNAIGIHIGQGEFAFVFAEAITNFVFNVSTNNLSNVRVYCTLGDCTPDDPNSGGGPVPIPGAVFLMGSVLAGGLGVGAMRRRRQRKAAA